MVVKSSFGVLSGEETAEFASDLPVYLQLPSRPLQPDDSGPSVKFSHRCYNGTVKRGRFGPRKESSVATTVFSTESPDETSGTKSLLLDIISSAEPSSRIPKTRKISRKFSKNDSVSSIATQFELSVSTSITSTLSQLSSTATTSESSRSAIATLLLGRTFAFSNAWHPGITNVTSVSSESAGNVIANRSTDTTSSSSFYQAINNSYQACNASYSGSAAGETTTWLKGTNFTSCTDPYRGRVAVGSDSTRSSASPWSKARSFVNSFSPSTSTITLDLRSFEIETVQNIQSTRTTTVAYYSTENTATVSESADMISTAPDSRLMNRSSTAREAAPSSAALSGTASSHASPATSAKDERADRSSLGELMSDATGDYSTFETGVAFRGTVSEAGEKPGQSTRNKHSWSVGDSGQNSTATPIRIGKVVTTMVPINSSLSANISGQY